MGTVSASDADTGDTLGGWQIKGGDGAGIFAIGAASGEVAIKHPGRIDFRRRCAYRLTLLVGDGKLPSHDEEVSIRIPDQVNLCHTTIVRNKGHRVRISHNTVFVAKSAVPRHFSAGDTIGGCPQ